MVIFCHARCKKMSIALLRTLWALQLVVPPSGAYCDEPDIAGHSDPEYHLDQVVVETSPFQDTLFNSVQSTSVISGTDLDEKAKGSLGDTLAAEPGVASSSFGPGAGRPVVRGLGGDRIRILENGVGTLDISNGSPDHPVTVESSLVDRIEVVRGPAALLYGTSAVGGVVNVLDRRIAETQPAKKLSGTVESRAESVDRSRAGVVGLDTSAGDFVFHLDGYKRASDDYHIPGYARTPQLREDDPVDPEPKGKLPSSFTNNDNVTLGTSYVKEKGFLGAAVSDYETTYGVPNGEPDVSINAERKRVDVRGGVRDTGALIESAIARVGLANYDQTEFEASQPSSRLSQKAIDSRLDFTHKEVASTRGTFGLQLQGSRFDVVGEEAFQPPTDSTTYSLFDLEEVLLSDTVTWQLGGRFDWNVISTPGFDRELTNEITKNQDSFSQSSGLVWDFAPDYAAALSLAHTERAPTGQELFAEGPHLAVGAYEIGDPNLGLERSLGTDLTLRKKEGRVRGFIGGYYNRFWDYISANPTGTTIDGLPVYRFEPINADFVGFESQVAFFAVDRVGKEVSFDIQPDYVWARDRDNSEYLPRIPPLRLLVGANYYDKDLCRVRLEVQQVFAQDKVAQYETTTDGYTMLNLYISKEVPWLGQNVEVFGRGTNLLSEKVRNHVSYIKDVAPLPGASAMIGFRVRF